MLAEFFTCFYASFWRFKYIAECGKDRATAESHKASRKDNFHRAISALFFVLFHGRFHKSQNQEQDEQNNSSSKNDSYSYSDSDCNGTNNNNNRSSNGNRISLLSEMASPERERLNVFMAQMEYFMGLVRYKS